MAFETRSRVKDYLIFGLVGLVLVFAGLWIGMKVENSAMKKQAQKDANISTKIAVVNQDMGVTYNNQKVNYSETFIESLGSDFVLVSPQVAAAGLEDGTYGAIITFPSNLSSSVVSINNQNPEQVSLSYVINPNLTGDKYVEVFEKIHNAQGSISDQMTYMYLTSILQEVHEAQDAIDDIYANNDEDVAEAKKLALTEFLKYLDLGDLEYKEPVWEEINFASYENGAAVLKDEMSQYYKGLYDDFVEDYGKFKGSQKDKLDALQTKSTDLKVAYDQDTEQLLQYIDDLETFAKRLEYYPVWLEYKTGNISASDEERFALDDPDDPFVEYFRRLETYDEWLLFIADPAAYAGPIDAYYAQEFSDAGFVPGTTTVWPYTSDIEYFESILKYENWLASQEDGYVNPYDPGDPYNPDNLSPDEIEGFENGTSIPEKYSLTFTYQDSTDWVFTFDAVYDDTKDAAGETTDPGVNTLIGELQDGFNNGFDTSKYKYDTDTMDGFVKSYNDLQALLKGEVEDSNKDNLATLKKAHSEYNKYVSEMRGDITDAYSDASDKLDKSLETFMAVKNDNSRDTKEKLDNLSGMLPYSRVNGNVNKTVVEFATTPIYVTEGASGMQEVAEVNTSGTHLLILIIALILAIVSLVVIFTNANQKKRREFASEPRRATAFFRDK